MEEGFIHPGSPKRLFRAAEVHRVPKAWGEEQWIVNRDYCGKKLILLKDRRCSMHVHQEKDEVFYIVSGKVMLEVSGQEFTLMPGDFIHIRPGEEHRFTGLEDSEIMEFSTHHREDDSFRSTLSGHVDPERFERQSALIRSFGKGHVLVVGDVMVDMYVEGSVDRLSPEAPIPVLLQRDQRHVPGGAANAARGVAAMGATVTLIGVCGDDQAGSLLETMTADAGVQTKLVRDSGRCTTEKRRMVTQDGHQLLRVDSEDAAPVSEAIAGEILREFERQLEGCQAVLLSDYAKGVLSPTVLSRCIAQAGKRGVPVILDPKPHDASYIEHVSGITLITPNRREAMLLTQLSDASAKSAIALAETLGCSVLFTLGADGMILAKDGTAHAFPAHARGVVDVSGAGDTVAAVLAAAMGVKADMIDAVDIANRAASIAVAKSGTAVVSADELLTSL